MKCTLSIESDTRNRDPPSHQPDVRRERHNPVPAVPPPQSLGRHRAPQARQGRRVVGERAARVPAR